MRYDHLFPAGVYRLIQPLELAGLHGSRLIGEEGVVLELDRLGMAATRFGPDLGAVGLRRAADVHAARMHIPTGTNLRMITVDSGACAAF